MRGPLFALTIILAGTWHGNAVAQDQSIQDKAAKRCLKLAAGVMGVSNFRGAGWISQEPGKPAREEFTSAPNGEFTFSLQRVYLDGAAKPVKLACTGDLNRQVIMTVEVDGVLKNPEKEEWKF